MVDLAVILAEQEEGKLKKWIKEGGREVQARNRRVGEDAIMSTFEWIITIEVGVIAVYYGIMILNKIR
jgi:hypothetical protein